MDQVSTLLRSADWRARVAAARAEWPGVEVDERGFAEYAMARLPDKTALDRLHTSDLYLACACARGDRHALALFEARLLSEVDLFIRRIDSAQAFADEVRQALRERLLVRSSPDREPKIASYSGLGPLGAWLRIAAVRIAHGLRQGGRPTVTPDSKLRAADPDPQAAYFRRHYGEMFREVVEETLASLSRDERAVLRLYYLEGSTLEAISRMYRVHASTVHRWIAEARRRVLDTARERLASSLKLGEDELSSVLGVIPSQLDLSLRRILEAESKSDLG